MKRILLCFDSITDVVEFYVDMKLYIRDCANLPYSVKFDNRKWTIEYGDYIIDFRPAKRDKLAGLTYEYFWSDNYECLDCLWYSYRGSDVIHAQLDRPSQAIDIIRNQYTKEKLKVTINPIYGALTARLGIKKVIFNNPATIVLWTDGTKTIVKCQDGETFDKEKGLAMAISKKLLGTNKSGSNFNDIFKKWCEEGK